jgi:zinc ribbon protein
VGPTKMLSFCSQCGAALQPEARFCEECGTRVSGRASSSVAHHKKMLLLAVLLLAAVLGIGAVVLFIFGPTSIIEQGTIKEMSSDRPLLFSTDTTASAAAVEFLTALQKGEFQYVWNHFQPYREAVQRIHVENPTVLWERLEAEAFELNKSTLDGKCYLLWDKHKTSCQPL